MSIGSIVALVGVGITLCVGGSCAAAEGDELRMQAVAGEVRQAIAMMDWFYVRHRACPQPSRLAELKEMQGGLGDGYSVEPHGQFVEIRGISCRAGFIIRRRSIPIGVACGASLVGMRR